MSAKKQIVTTAAVLLSLLLVAVINLAQEATKPKKQRLVPAEGFYTEAERFLFFAVLEGCYTDGLTEDDIERIIPISKSGRRDRMQNFVLTCPVCGPAFDAFSLYSTRPVLTKQVGKYSDVSSNTFGQGLDPEIRKQLAQSGQPCRDTVQGLIQKWVDARIELLRLTEEETKTLREALAKMRKKGEKALETFQSGKGGEWFQEGYRDWKKGCPICTGASPTMGVK